MSKAYAQLVTYATGRFRVKRFIYDRVKNGDMLEVMTRPGYHGVAWVTGYRRQHHQESYER